MTTRNKKLIRGVGLSISIRHDFEAIPIKSLKIGNGCAEISTKLTYLPRWVEGCNKRPAFDHSAILPPLRL